MRIINFDDGFTSSTAPVSMGVNATDVAVAPTGNLSSTDAQAALAELQGDIDTINAALIPHLADTSTHGVTGDIVGTTDTQTITNKAIVAADNMITTAANGNLTSTELNAALAELQADIDGRATPSDVATVQSNLDSHTSNTSNPHSVTATQVGLGNVDNTSDATKNSATATLTNKTLTAPLLSEGAAPSTPAAGNVALYAKTDKKLWTKDSAGNESQVGASGSGEINAVLSPNDANANWSAGTSHSVATLTTGAPLDPVITTAIRVTATANATESSTSGGAFALTMPSGLKGKRLKVDFYITSPVADTWKFSLYAGSTRVPLTIDSSSVTTLPAGVTGYKVSAAFDADSTSSYTGRFTRTGGSGTTNLDVTAVVIGPGIQPQSPKVGEWVTFTPSWSAAAPAMSANAGRYRQVGDSMEIEASFTASGAGTSSAVTLTVPSSYNIDTTKLSATSGNNGLCFGLAMFIDVSATVKILNTAVAGGSSTSLAFVKAGEAVDSIDGDEFASGDQFGMRATIPIAEWAGASNAFLGANDTDFFAHDGSNTVYGPDGYLVPNQAVGTAVTYDFTIGNVSSDTFILEIFRLGFGWAPAYMLYPRLTQKTKHYGCALYWTSATALRVRFEDGGAEADGTNYGDNSSVSWASLYSAAYKWRVRRIRAGNAVGFGTATPTSKGLVNSYAASVQSSIKSLSSVDYAIGDLDGYSTILVSTGASDRTVTLPSAANNPGREITIKKTDSGAGGVVISGTIDGGTTNNTILARYGYCTVISDGSAWYWKTDIHEIGSWTPVATCATPGTGANANQAGRYSRTGRTITLSGSTQYTKGTASGAFTVTGAPFAARNVTGCFSVLTCQIEDQFVSSANMAGHFAQMTANSSVITWTQNSAAAANNATGVTASNLGTSSIDVLMGGTYLID